MDPLKDRHIGRAAQRSPRMMAFVSGRPTAEVWDSDWTFP
jgi:hypothetical protein